MRVGVTALLGLVVTATASAATSPAQSRVVSAKDLPGYERTEVKVIRDKATWAQGNRFVDVATLRRTGFSEAAIEWLQAAAPGRRLQTSAIATVVHFRAPSGARAYLARMLAAVAPRYTRFSVPGVPRASGISSVSGPGYGGNYDVVFADGDFFYDLTLFVTDSSKPPTIAQTVAAATRWYRHLPH